MKFLIGIVFLLIPFSLFAASSGFITRTIWYTPEKFFAGDVVRIHAGIYNASGEDFSGTVEFFDNDEFLGETRFTLKKGGNAASVWVDWEPEEGRHVIVAKMRGDNGEAVSESIIEYVDRDTDHDALGDREDPDDDNDGFSDKDEIRLGLPHDTPTTQSEYLEAERRRAQEDTMASSTPVVRALERAEQALLRQSSVAKDRQDIRESFTILKDALTKRESRTNNAPGVFETLWKGSRALGLLAGKEALAGLLFLADNKKWALVVGAVAILLLWRWRRRRS